MIYTYVYIYILRLMVIVKNLESAWCFSITLRGLSWDSAGPGVFGPRRSSFSNCMGLWRGVALGQAMVKPCGILDGILVAWWISMIVNQKCDLFEWLIKEIEIEIITIHINGIDWFLIQEIGTHGFFLPLNQFPLVCHSYRYSHHTSMSPARSTGPTVATCCYVKAVLDSTMQRTC